ncbi:MAG: glycosyltransferase family 9 protein [Bacteroidetes bacterium]|jgi:ADP-heptose:LPS heptosyltransferase|nr:glycosyltransferase family 9 protein [Bacteroidota bacterium]
MQVLTQIWIDQHIVKPIIWSLNLLVRLVGWVLRLDHNLNRDFRVVAVCKYKGLGSIVQATALLQTIKHNLPNGKLVFVSTQANKELLSHITCIDQVVLLNDSTFWRLAWGYPQFIWQLIKLRIGVYIDLEIYSNFSSLSTTLSLARNRLGYYLRSGGYRMGIYTHMMYYNPRVPIMQCYMQMARLMGFSEEVNCLYPIKVNHASPIEGPYLVINPNASSLRLERRWAKERFAEMILSMGTKLPGYRVVLIGAPSEKGYVLELMELLPPGSVVNLAGATSFGELLCILGGATAVVTNDTGPMHLAAAMGKPTIGLFGPCSPSQYGSLQGVIPIYKEVYCSPCVHEFAVPPCKGNNHCMKEIGVGEVLEALVRLLEGMPFDGPLGSQDINLFMRSSNGELLGEVRRA